MEETLQIDLEPPFLTFESFWQDLKLRTSLQQTTPSRNPGNQKKRRLCHSCPQDRIHSIVRIVLRSPRSHERRNIEH